MNRKRKAAAAAAVTAVAAAGVMTHAAFDSPVDLTPEAAEALHWDQGDQDGQEAEQKGPLAKLRLRVLTLPAAVRMLVGVPLWLLGGVLLSAVSVFWAGTAPVLAGLVNWLCLALVLLGVFAASAKAAFPKVSVRRLLRLRNAALLLTLGTVFWAADLALPTVWDGYSLTTGTVWRVGAACALALVCGLELKHQGRQAAKAVPAADRTEVERAALALADTVCPPRDV